MKKWVHNTVPGVIAIIKQLVCSRILQDWLVWGVAQSFLKKQCLSWSQRLNIGRLETATGRIPEKGSQSLCMNHRPVKGKPQDWNSIGRQKTGA